MSEVRIVSAPFGGWDARVLEEHPDGHLRVEILTLSASKPPTGLRETLPKPEAGELLARHETSPSEDGLAER